MVSVGRFGAVVGGSDVAKISSHSIVWREVADEEEKTMQIANCEVQIANLNMSNIRQFDPLPNLHFEFCNSQFAISYRHPARK
jgi:hypothetical protein